MAYISKIKMPNGTTYDIKDANAVKADLATETTNGLMSAEDKTKLDGLIPKAYGDGVTVGVAEDNTVTISYDDSEDKRIGLTTYDVATESENGLMSADDKKIVDNISSGRVLLASPMAYTDADTTISVTLSQSYKNFKHLEIDVYAYHSTYSFYLGTTSSFSCDELSDTSMNLHRYGIFTAAPAYVQVSVASETNLNVLVSYVTTQTNGYKHYIRKIYGSYT